MKVAISIPNDLYETVERLVRDLKLSRSELYRQALRAYVANHNELEIAASLEEVYGHGGEDSRLDPALNARQLAHLPQDEW